MERRLVLKREWTPFELQTCEANSVSGAKNNALNSHEDVPSVFGNFPRLALAGDAEEVSTTRDSRRGIALIGLLLLVLLLLPTTLLPEVRGMYVQESLELGCRGKDDDLSI
jgi:hypothetical protein